MSRTYRNVIAKWVWDPVTHELREVPTGYQSKPIPAPAVHQDSMDALEHPANGKMYDSKAAFRRVTKAHGLEEIGNERNVAAGNSPYKGMRPEDYARSAKEAYEQCRSGNAPLSEYDREMCKRINERLRNRV